MRPEAEYQAALRLIESGMNDCEVGRRLGIPRGTSRDWRVGRAARSGGRTKHRSGRKNSPCPRCDDCYLDEEAYAYLLGMYLGDGCLSEHLLRGLIHSDGNRHFNPITRHFQSGTRHYRYLRYMFKSASDDILGIFTDALDLLEVHWTKPCERVISVARREDVVFLDTFVGPES